MFDANERSEHRKEAAVTRQTPRRTRQILSLPGAVVVASALVALAVGLRRPVEMPR
jgi:hypothetical protein